MRTAYRFLHRAGRRLGLELAAHFETLVSTAKAEPFGCLSVVAVAVMAAAMIDAILTTH